MHELRTGELAHFKLIPHTPYYGTADATPLYLIVLHNAWRCTGDAALLEQPSGDGREVPGLDRQLRRPRRRRLPGIPDPLAGRLREPGLEGFRRGAGLSRRLAGEGAQGAVRTAGLCLRRLAAHGARSIEALGDERARRALRAQGDGAVRALQRGVLGRGDRLLRLLPRRRQEAGAERRLQSPATACGPASCRRSGRRGWSSG